MVIKIICDKKNPAKNYTIFTKVENYKWLLATLQNYYLLK